MATFSGWWDTEDTTPIGDQVAEYTEAHLQLAAEIIAACHGFEGVGPGYLNKFAGTANPVAFDRTVRIASGGALVDGKWIHNPAADDQVLDVIVGGGNTRIDRIVLRTVWANKETTIYVIKGVEGGTPTAPAITQTSGTTYDIMLYQALLNDAGTVTLTDERVWGKISLDEMDDMAMGVIGRQTNTTGALSRIYTTVNDRVLMRKANEMIFAQVDSDQIATGAVDLAHMSANSVDSDQYVDGSIDRVHLAADIVDGTKIADNAVNSEHIAAGAVDLAHMSANSVDSDQYVDGSIDTIHLADNAVDDTKAGDRVPQFYRRQGGSATTWGTSGTTDRVPGAVRMQGGVISVTIAADDYSASTLLTFPVAFAYAPLLFLMVPSVSESSLDGRVIPTSVTLSALSVQVKVIREIAPATPTSYGVHWLAIGPE